MHPGFLDVLAVIPEAKTEIRYATSHNLTGEPLDGYRVPKALLTREAALALKQAADNLARLGYGILIYDAYRPQKAVSHFVRWSKAPEDGMTKAEFYPEQQKERLFELGYIALRSGHSRGSTVDLTLTKDGCPVDMGTAFDFMGDSSHHRAPDVSPEAAANRSLLCAEMARAGFAPYECEWWHYRLMKEPYPDTYFDFDIE